MDVNQKRCYDNNLYFDRRRSYQAKYKCKLNIILSKIMTKVFPTSLRWRVIMIRQRGLSMKQIAERLLVSETFVKKVIRLYEATGSVSDPPRSKSKKRNISAAEILLIRRAIEDNPELYLDELQAWIEYQTGEVYSIQTLSRCLRKMGLTVKKMQIIARQRDERRRAEFRRFTSQFKPEQFLFMDESSKDERTIQRKYGRSLGNTRVSKKGNFTRGTRYSVLAALSTQGIQAAHSVVGAFDRNNFEFTMEMFVLPHVGSVAMGEPCSVVVLDNCQIHYSQAVHEMIRAKGGIMVFLPPYSPDLNPIEECFSVGKAWLVRNQDLCERYPQRCFEIGLESISAEICAALVQDCGYV